jgi:hypothetical protein
MQMIIMPWTPSAEQEHIMGPLRNCMGSFESMSAHPGLEFVALDPTWWP